MGEKVYKPVMKEGDHLIHSKDNPDRVRGLSRDGNNQNPDIPEWEEFDLDDLRSADNSISQYSDHEVQLTPAQEQQASQLGDALAGFMLVGGTILFDRVVLPWWKKTAWPWVKEQGRQLRVAIKGEKKQKKVSPAKRPVKSFTNANSQLSDVSAQIDAAFDQIFWDLDEEELREHMMRLIHHMFGLVNEIRIISNSRIRQECDNDAVYLERQKEVELFLSERVANSLNQLLSNEHLRLDLNTSRELVALTGGGVHVNSEYVPVQVEKISETLRALPTSKKQ